MLSTERDVNVGTSPLMAAEKRHGLAWVRNEKGGQQSHSFMVDNPDALRRPNNATVGRLFRQLKKMGIHAFQIELHTDDKIRVFKHGFLRPVMVDSSPRRSSMRH